MRANARSGASVTLPLVIGLLAAPCVVPCLRAAAPPHFDPRSLPVPFSGEPWYVEFAPSPDGRTRNGVTGSPVADYGSHFGVKANLWEHRPLFVANYSAVAGLAGKLDRSVIDVLDAAGNAVPLSRSVEFTWWGWRETATGEGVTVAGSVVTIDTDAFLFTVTVSAAEPVALRLRVIADDNSNALGEGSVPTAPGAADAAFDAEANELVVRRAAGDQTLYGLLTSATESYRVYRLSLPIASTAFSPGLFTYSFDLTTAPISGTTTLVTTLGVGLSKDAARARAEAASVRVGRDAAATVAAIDAEWKAFLNGLPKLPRGAGAVEKRLYRLANTALRMNLYAPRAAMTGWGSVPSKTHFDLFFGWDTPLQAIGYAEWADHAPPWVDESEYSVAEQMLLLQLASELPNGQICITHDDSLVCPLPITQPPLQGWAAWEVARRDPDPARAARFLSAAYDKLARFYGFWFAFRDWNFNGLPEYRFGLEYGWDDTPRYSASDQSETEAFLPTLPVEPVDLASWLALYAGSMGRIAAKLGRIGESEHWRAEARTMASRIESSLWDASRGAWMDRLGSSFVSVRTPAMWWPTFAGAAVDSTHSTTVVERHLLDPTAFFGTYPIPSVAYDDPLYDVAEGGYYWQGQIWMVPAYASLVALARTGHTAEAKTLLRRLVSMIAKNGGIFETYDALTGEIGWGALGGPGMEQSAFQFGWSSSLLSEALLGRYADVPGALE
jgi:Trehalase